MSHGLFSRMILAGGQCVASGSTSEFGLNTAYTHYTSGNAVGIRYHCPSASTIDELYVFANALTGTIGNITAACDIYNESSVSRPGNTLRDSATAVTIPAAATMWIKCTFGTPYTPAIGEILWFIFYNTSGAPATDYPRLRTNTSHTAGGASGAWPAAGYTHTTGFSSGGTAVLEIPFVAKQGSDYFGQPFTINQTAYYTSNTRRRGIQITPSVNTTVNGAIFTGSTAYDALEIYDNTTAPGGTPLHSFDLDSTANLTSSDATGAIMFSPVTLTGGVTYKVVLTYTSANQGPNLWQIEDYSSFSSVFDTLRAEDVFSMPWGVIDDGAGGWTVDKGILPSLALLVSSLSSGATTIIAPRNTRLSYRDRAAQSRRGMIIPSAPPVYVPIPNRQRLTAFAPSTPPRTRTIVPLTPVTNQNIVISCPRIVR